MNEPVKTAAIAANLDALAAMLRDAAALATEAKQAMDDGQRNQAIGTILPVGELLPAAGALLGAAMALHRA